jgi:hypothetical protein
VKTVFNQFCFSSVQWVLVEEAKRFLDIKFKITNMVLVKMEILVDEKENGEKSEQKSK